MDERRARTLLDTAARERGRLRRHLLVAAALREALPHEPIVVGGTAEEFWTADEYHETDLDLCVPFNEEESRAMSRLGFERDGRHWINPSIAVAVEVPDSRIDGDISRTVLAPVGPGAARIIGVDDLYLDRLRQATMREDHEGIEFHSALAVAASCFDRIDWRYVDDRVATLLDQEAVMGRAMRKLDSKLRARVRREVDE